MKTGFLTFIKLSLGALLLSGAVLPAAVLAASASVYPSPSKTSVTKGDTFSVQVRVNSGSDPMNAAEARLNFNGSKVQYSSYSVGGSPFDVGVSPSITGSSFKISRARTGGSITSDRLLVTVTFKAKASGTASFTIDQAVVADDGTAFGSVSTGSTSVTIKNPPSSGGGGSSGGGTTTDGGFESSPETSDNQDDDKPKFSSGPELSASQSTITVSFTTDKPTTATVKYGAGDKRRQSLSQKQGNTEHVFVIGQDEPLIPGTQYSLQIEITDAKDQRAKSEVLSARTLGVTYRLMVVDKTGQPLANHALELHSDPIQAMTNSQGVAEFNDVTPGDHTLVLTIDGLSVRQPVRVGAEVTPAGNSDTAAIERLVLPFSLSAAAVAAPAGNIEIYPLMAAAAAGALLTLGLPWLWRHWPAGSRAKLWLALHLMHHSTLSGLKKSRKHTPAQARVP